MKRNKIIKQIRNNLETVLSEYPEYNDILNNIEIDSSDKQHLELHYNNTNDSHILTISVDEFNNNNLSTINKWLYFIKNILNDNDSNINTNKYKKHIEYIHEKLSKINYQILELNISDVDKEFNYQIFMYDYKEKQIKQISTQHDDKDRVMILTTIHSDVFLIYRRDIQQLVTILNDIMFYLNRQPIVPINSFLSIRDMEKIYGGTQKLMFTQH